jgi:two-component system cell cycle response regulator DivK
MKTILMMEDDPYQSRLMQRLLEHAGYRVVVAPDAESGLHAAMVEPPDLILLDMGLPDLDGQTVAGLIRGSTLLSAIPLIAVTAWPQDTASEMARVYGCDGYISKPISAREFASQIAAYFKSTSADS